MSETTDKLNRECADCGHPEDQHSYSPPMHSSSDGLARFEGCWGAGAVNEEYAPDEEPIPRCSCNDFDPGDEDEGAIDYHPFRCGANCEVCADR